jgi:hypothetical protein
MPLVTSTTSSLVERSLAMSKVKRMERVGLPTSPRSGLATTPLFAFFDTQNLPVTPGVLAASLALKSPQRYTTSVLRRILISSYDTCFQHSAQPFPRALKWRPCVVPCRRGDSRRPSRLASFLLLPTHKLGTGWHARPTQTRAGTTVQRRACRRRHSSHHAAAGDDPRTRDGGCTAPARKRAAWRQEIER